MIHCPEFCKGGCFFLSLGVHVECFGLNLTHQKVSMLVSSWFLKFSSLLVWRIQNSPKTWILPMSMFNLWLMFQPCFPGNRRIVVYHISFEISQPEFKDYQGWVSLKPLTLQETNISCFPAGTFLSRWFSISTRLVGPMFPPFPTFGYDPRNARRGTGCPASFTAWSFLFESHIWTHTHTVVVPICWKAFQSYKWNW